MSKIILDDNFQSSEKENPATETPVKIAPRPNIFKTNVDPEKAYSSFPGWDILPPDQFINPRMKV